MQALESRYASSPLRTYGIGLDRQRSDLGGPASAHSTLNNVMLEKSLPSLR
jgi:hypothetical protein